MIIPAPADLAARYRISNGSRFRLKDIDPADPWGKRLKPIAGEMLKQGRKRMASLQERLYAQDRWSVLLIFQAMDAAGKDGTIKHVMSRRQPAGLRGPLVQGAVDRGARSRFPVAHQSAAAAPRAHRHLQSLVLRRDAGRARAPEHPGQAAAADGAGHQEHLARAIRRHQRLRALPVAAGRAGPEVLPARLEGRAAQALPRAARQAREELEVLARRRRRAQALRRLHGGLRRHDPPHRHRRGAVVRGSGRSQVVHAAGGLVGDHRRHPIARSALS